MARRRVVVSGLGIVCPLGNTASEAWSNAVDGRSGIASITRFDASDFSTRFAGEVKGFDIENYISRAEARLMDTFVHYGVAAGLQAMKDSGLEVTDENADRIGVLVGSGIGGLPMIEATQSELLDRGPESIPPFFMPASSLSGISAWLSVMLGIKGPNMAMVTACATGLHCIGQASRLIEYGDADVMFAGGAESSVSPLGLGGFAAARALSQRNDDPAAASRPWDRDRDGFVLGEGAGVMVLEEYEHARARGARVYAEVAGYGMSGDAFHVTGTPADGSGIARAMQAALSRAAVNPDLVGCVNAHSTSTVLGDRAETNAIKKALGQYAGGAVVTSTKSMTGHMLAAAGAVESIFSVLTLHGNVCPPTINLSEPGEGCDLDYCRGEARQIRTDVVVKNSFGFGGTNGSLVFVRPR